MSQMVVKKIGFWQYQHDPNGIEQEWPNPTEPHLINPDWQAEYRQDIVSYLQDGRTCQRYRGYSSCRFSCGIDFQEMGTKDLTDGIWCWPEGLQHYVDCHDTILPGPFIDHMKLNDFKVPESIDWIAHSDGLLGLRDGVSFDIQYWLDWHNSLLDNG